MNINQKIKEQKEDIDMMLYELSYMLNDAVNVDILIAYRKDDETSLYSAYLDGRLDAFNDPNVHFDEMKGNELINYAFEHHDWIIDDIINICHHENFPIGDIEIYQYVSNLINSCRKELVKLNKLKRIKKKLHIK